MGQLREGIDRGELIVFYQPKVSVDTGRIWGAEALVRWRHPTRGLLTPAQFLSAVENSGLITSLTDQVIDNALATVQQWRASGIDSHVAINLTARQIANLDLDRQFFAQFAGQALLQRFAGFLLAAGELPQAAE